MTQRDLVKLAGAAVVGLAAGLVLAVTVWDAKLLGGRDTRVTLSLDASGACTLGKETKVRARMSENMTWKIENYCPGEQRTVAVGNFRLSQGPPTPANCTAAGADYPFAAGARDVVVDPGDASGRNVKPAKAKLTLKALGPNELGEAPRVYFFDICLDGTKADPELMMER